MSLILDSTTDIIRVVTSGAANITGHIDYIDYTSPSTFTPASITIAPITMATTQTILSAPSAGVFRKIKGVYLTNNSASVSSQATVQFYDGTNSADLMGVTLLPGENLVMDSTGSWTHHDAQGGAYQGRPVLESWNMLGMNGTIAESIPRILCNEANLAALTSGTMFLQAVYLRAGQRITNISFCSATTAAATPTNQIFGLYDVARNLLAQTSNDTTTAWAANTLKTRALTAPYTITGDGVYYVAILVTATTVPTLKGLTAKTNSALAGLAPILHGNSTTGLTTSLPASATAITVGVNAVWCALT